MINKHSVLKKLILFTIIFTSIFCICSITFASDFQTDIKRWLDRDCNWPYELDRFKFKDSTGETFAYLMRLPELDVNYPICVDNQGHYYFQEKNGNSYGVSRPLEITFKAEVRSGDFITSSQLLPTTQGGNLVLVYFPQISRGDGNDDVVIMADDKGTKLYEGNERIWDYIARNNDQGNPFNRRQELDGPRENHRLLVTVRTTDGSNYVIEDYEVTASDRCQKVEHKGEGLLDWLRGILEAIKDWVFDKISSIFTNIFLNIGDGLHNVIKEAWGEEVTIGTIVYNNNTKTSIDFWTNPVPEYSIISYMQTPVDYWYRRFRAIAIVCYLGLLLYLGIKILLSPTALKMEQIKERLNVWLFGVLVLFLYPFFMRYMVTINDTVIEMIETKGGTMSNEEARDSMQKVYDTAKDQNSIPLAICYIIMLGELLVLLFVYYKRAFTIGFLIAIFPIVCIKHLFDGIQTKRSRTLQAWTQEYCVQVFIQIVHAVTYAIVVEAPSQALLFIENSSSGKIYGGNIILFIICVLFMFKAEQIIKAIFDVKSASGTMSDLMQGGAAAFAFGRQAVGGAKELVSSSKTDNEKKDKKDEEELDDKTKRDNNNNKQKIRESAQGMNESGGEAGREEQQIRDDTNRLGAQGQDGQRPEITPQSLQEGQNRETTQEEELEKAKAVMGASGLKRRNNTFESQYDKEDLKEKGKAVLNAKGLKNKTKAALSLSGSALKGTGKTILHNAPKAGIRALKTVGKGAATGAAVLTAGVATIAAGGGAKDVLANSISAGRVVKTAGKGVEMAATGALKGVKALGSKGVIMTDKISGKLGLTGIQDKIREHRERQYERMKQELKDKGVDTDKLFEGKKGEIIAKALQQYKAGMVIGGKSFAESAFTHQIVSQKMETDGDKEES